MLGLARGKRIANLGAMIGQSHATFGNQAKGRYKSRDGDEAAKRFSDVGTRGYRF